jgi:hypothetical protein
MLTGGNLGALPRRENATLRMAGGREDRG